MQNVPSVGFFSTKFPSDPISFGKYSEQVAIGQITETLVSTDAQGELAPSLAESWSIHDNGTTIRFKLKSGLQFSNGQPIRARDAAFSIERHQRDQRSQSHGFLADVASISADDDRTLTIKLHRPRVAIFKVLGRDQLGVMPEGWSFDPNSKEPYIGSGAYRLLNEGGHWFLLKNERYRLAAGVTVPKWKLVLSDDPEIAIKAGTIPDVVFSATERMKELVDAAQSKTSNHSSEEQVSFLQASIWWYPHGKNYSSPDRRRFVMGLMRELVALRRTKSSWTKATSVVPIGVSGYLPESLEFSAVERPTSIPKEETVEIPVAIYRSIKSWFFGDDKYAEIEKRFNVRFKVIETTEKDYDGDLHTKAPDVVVDAWFGGFNDPEGFLLLLPKILGVDFDRYLGDIAPTYRHAMVEQDWKQRAELFRTFNRMLVQQERMVPTWRVPTFTMLAPTFRPLHKSFRYTHRLTDLATAGK